MHGKYFEDCLKTQFDGASYYPISHTAAFDISEHFDFEKIPTSVKSTNSKLVCMADARRIFKIKRTFRLLVCCYHQDMDFKKVKTIREYIITPEEMQSMKCGIDYTTVKKFHDSIRKYRVGQHYEARMFAKNYLNEHIDNSSLIKLNPKIDSKRQRRLQCSISLDVLDKHVAKKYIHTDTYRELNISSMLIYSPKKKAV